MHKVVLLKNAGSFDPPNAKTVEDAIEVGTEAGWRFVQLATGAAGDISGVVTWTYLVFEDKDILIQKEKSR